MLREAFLQDGYYHVYNRGVEKRTIFLKEWDYERFLALLYLGNSETAVDLRLQGQTLEQVITTERGETLTDICAYCLMPNHFHFLLREKRERGISTFMQKITTAYTMYFNRLNERSGALFQGTYKSKRAEQDEYLKYLVSYIHLNPVKLIDPLWKEKGIANIQKAESFLQNYRYSSYPDFISQRERREKVILAIDSLPEYFGSSTDFVSTTRDWFNASVDIADTKVKPL